MRKEEREIKDFDEILKVLEKCDTIRLGLYDEPYPYIVPLSFGMENDGGKLLIYFHCAKEGKKIDLIAKNNAVCVEADILDGYKRVGHGTTADYQSVIGFGHVELIVGEAAVHGLDLLLEHCKVSDYPARDCVLAGAVAVCKITIDSITGKRRFPPSV